MKVIDRIKKLMALSNSPNPNEAAAALSKARRLMDAYDIKQSDLIQANIKEQNGKAYKAATIPTHIAKLSRMVADLFACDFYCNTFYSHTARHKYRGFEDKYKTRPVFIGYDPHLQLCKYCYDNLARRLTKARDNFRPITGNRSETIAAKNSFAIGWVEGVRKNILHLIPPKLETEIPSSGGGLVKVNPLAVYLSSDRFKNGKSKSTEIKDAALNHGYEQGEKVQINKGVVNPDALQLN